jgi:hypothetical protein
MFPHTLTQRLAGQQCPACGSTWFREAPSVEFVQSQFRRPHLNPEPDPGPPVLICLWGTPLLPQTTSPPPEVRRLLENVKQVQYRLDARGDAQFLLQGSGVESSPPGLAGTLRSTGALPVEVRIPGAVQGLGTPAGVEFQGGARCFLRSIC